MSTHCILVPGNCGRIEALADKTVLDYRENSLYTYPHAHTCQGHHHLSQMHNFSFNPLLLGFSRNLLKWLKCPVHLPLSTTRSL